MIRITSRYGIIGRFWWFNADDTGRMVNYEVRPWIVERRRLRFKGECGFRSDPEILVRKMCEFCDERF